MTKFNSSRQPSATQTVAKKHLKTHLKRIRNREYCRLRDMVPAIANKQKVSKVSTFNHSLLYYITRSCEGAHKVESALD